MMLGGVKSQMFRKITKNYVIFALVFKFYMNIKYHNFLTALILGVLVASCSGRNKSKDTDSAADDRAENMVTEAVAERLPDTAYQSADRLKYVVEVLDTTVNGRLESLADLYSAQKSVMLFRKGPKRDARFESNFDTIPTQIEVDWKFLTDEQAANKTYARWGGGSGWNGQPNYIEWPDSLAQRLKASGIVNDNFTGKEVLFGSLIGKVYFLNPDNGKITREPINVVNPIKGTVSADPTFNGNLYVGQGIPAQRPFGAIVIDMFSNKVSDTFGEDPKAYRQWGAYDSSPVRVDRFLFRPAENGSLYKFVIEPGKQRLHSVLRYRGEGSALGIEASMAVYANYGFIADNHGNITAVNLDTMKPVWHYWLGDDTDATPLVAVEEGTPYLYVGSEEDLSNRGVAKFAKLNALNGEEVWSIDVPAKRKSIDTKHFDGGFYASPLLGEGNAEGLIFTNVVKNLNGSNGSFIAIDRKTGKVVYDLPLKHYAWSSPVGGLTKKGEMVVVTGDCAGNIYIIDAKQGKIITSKTVGYNFESSPVLIGNSIFVGSRSNGFYKISFK